MSFLSTANMNLPVPVVGQESGPQYAIDINSCFTLLDQHDHTPGKGVQITPNALNINATLDMAGNFLDNAAGVTFQAQGSTPALGTIYESGVDLYYVDGNGNNVRITQLGGVAGAPGSISNLTPPASASYVSGSSTFVWQSDTNIAANMDMGSLLLRNLSPNSTFALTLQPPAGLSSNYTITLPALPGASSFLTIDSSGSMSATPAVSKGIVTSMIADQAITTTQIANTTIINGNIANGTITAAKIANPANIVPTQLDSTSTGEWFSISDPSGSFTTGSSTNVNVTNMEVTLAAYAPNRPVFISFSGGSIGVSNSSSSLGPISAGATFTIYASNHLTTQDLATFTIAANGTNTGSGTASVGIKVPCGSLNYVALNPAALVFRPFIFLECKSTGGTVSVTDVIMTVFQV